MSHSPANVHRPTRLIVDLGKIESNARIILERLTPGTRLMAVVKANGYGHGAIESARAAHRGGATFLGVATVEEARELREAGLEVPILVLGSSDPLEAPGAARIDVALGVGDVDQAQRLLNALEEDPPSRPLEIHLKVDTGMRRFGVSPAEALVLSGRLHQIPHVRVAGIYSHFAASDGNSLEPIDRQFELFETVRSDLANSHTSPEIAHISNSAALLRNRTTDLTMVRAGICLYGITPSEHVELFSGMRPALEWRATVQHIAEMAPGDRTGYGGTYVATEHERIAVLPIGYADGFPRALSNFGWVGWQGNRLPVRGRVSMDQCAVGIPPGVRLHVGDEVTVIGETASGAPSANELAESIGTIGYEIVARLSRRIPVEYI